MYFPIIKSWVSEYVGLRFSLLPQWMKEMWRSDSCYGNYGVDGSTCSFFIYLSEVSTECACVYLNGVRL